jgi:UDP-N-acetylmuramoylalanine-D-glutamate ligase
MKFETLDVESNYGDLSRSAQSAEAHNQVRFTTSKVFGTAKLRVQYEELLRRLMISLGLCLSLSLKLENVSTKLRSVRSVPHLLPLFVMYHRR